jgi:hypothetical protein
LLSLSLSLSLSLFLRSLSLVLAFARSGEQGDVKDDVVPLIVKEFGIAISDIYFLEGNGLKVFFYFLFFIFLFISWRETASRSCLLSHYDYDYNVPLGYLGKLQ